MIDCGTLEIYIISSGIFLAWTLYKKLTKKRTAMHQESCFDKYIKSTLCSKQGQVNYIVNGATLGMTVIGGLGNIWAAFLGFASFCATQAIYELANSETRERITKLKTLENEIAFKTNLHLFPSLPYARRDIEKFGLNTKSKHQAIANACILVNILLAFTSMVLTIKVNLENQQTETCTPSKPWYDVDVCNSSLCLLIYLTSIVSFFSSTFEQHIKRVNLNHAEKHMHDNAAKAIHHLSSLKTDTPELELVFQHTFLEIVISP